MNRKRSPARVTASCRVGSIKTIERFAVLRNMLMELASEFRSLRAPQDDGQKLIYPQWSSLPDVVETNRRQLSRADCDLQGRRLSTLSASARHTLVQRAIEYTSRYRDVSERVLKLASSATPPFILSGHQPQLVHPGVWYKSFVLGRLAHRTSAVGIHLLIDSDLCRSVSIRVPTGSIDEPRVEAVAYDEPSPEVPYEERAIRDVATLANFAQRVMALVKPFVAEPIVEQMWPLVLERNPAQNNLGLRMAQGRHAYEESWHNDTLELPQSAVCQLPEFAWFVAHVLAHLPRFWAAHNDALSAYRRAHRLRNRAQPVPDLDEVDGWLESPFWIWSTSDPQRRPLFAHQSADEITLTDRHAHSIKLSLSADADAKRAVEQLLSLAGRGIKIRTRALTTTLFARLMLSDLFLHGIGGAKYDQVTDQIARQFFGFELPKFATVSATLRLPIPHPPVNAVSESELTQQMRQLRYHPERFATDNGQIAAEKLSKVEQLVAAKRRWVKTAKTRENARQRHAAITAANNALQPYVSELRHQLEWQKGELAHRKRANAVLDSREYSFCLHPRQHFQRLLLDDPALLP
jgi:hypothetical protein